MHSRLWCRVSGASSALKPAERDVRVTRGASYLIIQNLGVNVVTVAAFVILARLISTREMGIYAILQLINGVCVALFTWFPQAVTKFVAENISRGRRDAAAAIFYQALRANLLIYLPVVAVTYLYAATLASRLLGGMVYVSLVQILAVDLLFNPCILWVVTSTLMGLGLFREIAAVGLIVGGFLRQLLIISLIVLMRSFLGLVMGWLISDATSVALYLLLVLRALGPPRFDFPLTKLFRYYLPIEFASITNQGQNWFDRALLAFFVPLATLGIYNAALTAFSVLTGVTAAIGNVLLPAYSSIERGTSGANTFSDAVRLATRYTCFTLIPLAFGLFAVAKPALTLFVGESYVGGYTPLAILCGVLGITAFGQALAPVFLALEETWIAASITGGTVLISLVVAYMLLPGWGIIGASTGRALQMVLSTLLIFLVLRRKVTLRLEFGTIAKTTLAGAVMATVVLTIQVLAYSKWMLPVYALLGAVTYLVMLRLLRAVDESDLKMLERLLGKRMRLVSNFLGRLLIA